MPLGKGKTSKLANKMRGEWVGVGYKDGGVLASSVLVH